MPGDRAGVENSLPTVSNGNSVNLSIKVNLSINLSKGQGLVSIPLPANTQECSPARRTGQGRE
jgi:hypothetical protein